MSRARLIPSTLLLLTFAACQAAQPSVAPEQAAQTPELAHVLAELEHAQLDREGCMEFDAQLRAIDGERVLDAQYARAELAWRCSDAMLWQTLHEELAQLGHEPSFTRLVERALEREQWSRALRLIEEQRARPAGSVASERLDALALGAARAQWHARADKQDYELVEHLLERALAKSDPRSTELELRLDLIELYLEYVGLGPDDGFDDGPDGLLLAQLNEERARELLAKRRDHSAELEYLAGFIRELEGDSQGAVAAWQEALRIDPDYVEPHMRLGLAALERGDYELAKRELHLFLDGQPNHEDARYTLALVTRRAQAARAAAQTSEAGEGEVESPSEVELPAAR